MHKLKFIQHLQEDTKKAILYSRQNFNNFSEFNEEIKKLMGSLIYAKNIKNSPYSYLLNDEIWEDIYFLFHKEFCNLQKLSINSPLYVVTNSGLKLI
jgi:hypothetical protein